MDDTSKMNDHDLLVTMHEQLKGVKADVRDIKDGTSRQLADHEHRIKMLEIARSNQKISMAIYISIGAFLVGLLIYHILG
jgi:hypothetical protein